MKSAIVHDWITGFDGSVKVLEAIYRTAPSPIYTLLCDRTKIKGTLLENASIHTSFLQSVPCIRRIYRNLLPLFVHAVETFDLSQYDVVVSSSHSVAKNALTFSHQYHICYCHTPMRYAWDLYFEYLRGLGLKRHVAAPLMNYIRLWDRAGADRVDLFVANSRYTKRRIEKFYGRTAEVLYPPVRTAQDVPLCREKEGYYVTVSRFVRYKRVDLIVKAFNMMPDRELVVIGDGPEKKYLQRIAGGNIRFTGFLDSVQLGTIVSKARGFVFAADEDFGIAPVEAQGFGVPVIAFGKGGALETVRDGETGVFFPRQDEESLIAAVERFEEVPFDYDLIRRHALEYSPERFAAGFTEILNRV